MTRTDTERSLLSRIAQRPAWIAGGLLALLLIWLGSGLVTSRDRPRDQAAPAVRIRSIPGCS